MAHGSNLNSYFGFQAPAEVEVWWWDIDSILGWVDNDAISTKMMPKPVKTIGYLAYEDDFKVIVAGHVDSSQIADRTVIPKGVIRRIIRRKRRSTWNLFISSLSSRHRNK